MIHPSKTIIGEKSKRLVGKKVILGITSSAAIYRSIDLARELMRHGAEVYVVMTNEAVKLISPEMFKWATGNPVLVDLTGDIEHISYTYDDQKNTIMVIAPATANTMTKLSLGITDNALLTTALSAMGNEIPLIVVPAMHLSMWNSPQIKKTISKLKEMGVEIVEPYVIGDKAKYPPNAEIVEYIFRAFTPKNLSEKKVVVSAGATRIYIDDIRFISNPSSGKMGIAMALEAWLRGAEVTLILSKSASSVVVPRDINIVSFETYEEAKEALLKYTESCDVFIHAAAISDFKPVRKSEGKIKSEKSLELILEPTEKILELVAKKQKAMYVIAFKAEWRKTDDELAESAKEYIESGEANAVVANDVSRHIFGSDETDVILVYKDRDITKIRLTGLKREVAGRILDLLFR